MRVLRSVTWSPWGEERAVRASVRCAPADGVLQCPLSGVMHVSAQEVPCWELQCGRKPLERCKRRRQPRWPRRRCAHATMVALLSCNERWQRGSPGKAVAACVVEALARWAASLVVRVIGCCSGEERGSASARVSTRGREVVVGVAGPNAITCQVGLRSVCWRPERGSVPLQSLPGKGEVREWPMKSWSRVATRWNGGVPFAARAAARGPRT